jgi:hypothetical protein
VVYPPGVGLSAGGLIAENGWFSVSSPCASLSRGSTAHQYRLMQNVISPLHFYKAGFQQEFA